MLLVIQQQAGASVHQDFQAPTVVSHALRTAMVLIVFKSAVAVIMAPVTL